jgi:hypothetical protein
MALGVGLWAWLAQRPGVAPSAATPVSSVASSPASAAAPTELVADIDGDGTPDKVWVSTVPGKADSWNRVYVEADIGASHFRFGPYSCRGPARPAMLDRLPPELKHLQLLPSAPLGLADVNLDGTMDVVVNLFVPINRTNLLTVVFVWDPDHRALRQVCECQDDVHLCMDATGAGPSVIVDFTTYYSNLDPPIPGHMVAWDGTEFSPLPLELPARLGEALLPLYARATLPTDEGDRKAVLEARAKVEAAAGPVLTARYRVHEEPGKRGGDPSSE